MSKAYKKERQHNDIENQFKFVVNMHIYVYATLVCVPTFFLLFIYIALIRHVFNNIK